MLRFAICLILVLTIFFAGADAQDFGKHRVIILTDIEADPDDTQSLVRLLLYSNEIEIKGLVATTSCWQQNAIHPRPRFPGIRES